MKELLHIREDLIEKVYELIEANACTNFKHINTCELGDVIDMIKDLSEAIYYCTLAESEKHNSEHALHNQNIQ